MSLLFENTSRKGRERFHTRVVGDDGSASFDAQSLMVGLDRENHLSLLKDHPLTNQLNQLPMCRMMLKCQQFMQRICLLILRLSAFWLASAKVSSPE